ncbi:MAG: hypothetical protein A2469_00880 [Candidatus Magasanikbacteria bacterium RIFOXYC2_FULL_40_16]|uniref:Uncharacterized protein n=3 Tax=Candidatus Magasanikiibacteriota TaxID=1752731 RepID=A0A1F6NHJ4_9BACT|nr:MAG: hypothetical protein A2224_02990 [Candidatus Magasanikbacteria bacterium RIFOXYA2_FULL_40_20]OGH83233.1 MAG: hypothetical protein A2373_01615 [Candidatus Magasanikbacteria bacterium RIFOXYB1_FULL_40_15]OGH85165.1 MAG: hypothetical protein A2301_03230 [Candidatus Magasanikbacteria bacterium RIFOXYB2_FULL_40_13]OGH87069.1 MAG: hypothetical protein A2206_02680 [Candidatus Magasanikbacteria bacterium RIFOXYA1_FULL_40_8]OGH89516.1 MAG: hypothetical protein A2469_00880 [Candidatus Magasanikba
MGFFSSPSDKYSQELKHLPVEDFKRIFRGLKTKSLSQDEEDLAHRELEKHITNDGKISMRNVYNTIHSLKNKKMISLNDEEDLMGAFEDYFNK